MNGRRRAAVLGAWVVSTAIASARAETVQVPRDIGELPVATFDWVDGPGGKKKVAGELVVVERDRPRRVEAYDLRGRRRWASALVGDERLEETAVNEALVVVATEQRIAALDKATGRRRWTWSPPKGSVVGAVRALDATFVVREDLAPEEGDWRERRAFVQLDARNGDVRWRSVCPDKLCTFVDNAAGALVIDGGGGFRSLTPDTGAVGPHVDVIGTPIAAAGDTVLSCAAEKSQDSFPPYGAIQLAAYSLSEGRRSWQVGLGPGNPLLTAVRRAGDAWVVLTSGRLDVLDAATGATRAVVRLPDVVDFDRALGALPDGRLVGVVRTSHDWRTALNFVLVVDPTAPHPVAFWATPPYGYLSIPAGAEASSPPFFDHGVGLGAIRATPQAAPRASRSLAGEVTERLDRLAKAPSALDESILRRLGPTAYDAAVLARLDDAKGGELDRLVGLLATPPVTTAARDALSRVLERVLAGDLRAQLHVALALLEALPGRLPEAPMRKVADAIATNLRRGEAMAFAVRFLELLWRAPYPDLDAPLRAAVAAVGATTTGRADCPPRNSAFTEKEQVWADLSWQLFGPTAAAEPVYLVVPVDSPALECLDISTLGKPVILGSEQFLTAIKAGKPRLALRYLSSAPLSPEGKYALEQLDPAARAALGDAPLREAAWSFHIAPLNAGGRRALIARVAGRWRIVTTFVRWVS